MEIKQHTIAGITTFNPKISRLKTNIDSISQQVSELLIIDNKSDNVEQIHKLSLSYSNVRLICNEENEGIAFAMNQIGKYAYENQYGWFLTLDQDSVCPSDLIVKYSQYVNPHVGIISPKITFNNSFLKSLFLRKVTSNIEQTDVAYVKYAVSSGQLINTKAWKKAQGFWNFLFIDYVDQEFCFHITKLGYKIIRLNNCELSHEPGIPVTVLGIPTAKQSAFREYFWARNSFLVYWLYPKEYKNAPTTFPPFVVLKRIANAILIQESVIKKVKAIFKGVFDAYKWRLKYGKNNRYPLN